MPISILQFYERVQVNTRVTGSAPMVEYEWIYTVYTSTVKHGVFRGSGMDLPSQGTPYLLGSWNPSWGQFPGDKYSRHMPQEDGSSAFALAVVICAHVGMVLWNSFHFSDFCQVSNSFFAQMSIINHSDYQFFFFSFLVLLATILSSLSNFTTKPQWSLVKWLRWRMLFASLGKLKQEANHALVRSWISCSNCCHRWPSVSELQGTVLNIGIGHCWTLVIEQNKNTVERQMASKWLFCCWAPPWN